MSALHVTGAGSRIVAALRELLPAGERVVRLGNDLGTLGAQAVAVDGDRFLLCAGVLHQKTIVDQTPAEVCESLAVNLISAVRICEAVLEAKPQARICVVGSESAFKGSYDTTYAVAKAGLHRYVETRALAPDQQLVAVAPHIIWDSGMTQRRHDVAALRARANKDPARRYLRAVEVARLIRFLLYEDEGAITNTVIRMNGGRHAR